MTEAADRDAAAQAWISTECFCGRRKQTGRSFCARCYYSLPVEMQDDLDERYGPKLAKYPAAYARARYFLEQRRTARSEERNLFDGQRS